MWLQSVDTHSEIVPVGLGPRGDYRRPPYIFNTSEIAALITKARRLDPPWWASSVACSIGLAAAAGLRPGEIYRLRCADIDVAAGRLSVLDSKAGRSRILPLHPSTTGALAEHLHARDTASADHGHLFVTATGAPLRSPVFSPVFRQLVDSVGITVADGHRPARFGDLRHSFAVTTLADWHDTGADVQPRLPVLSAYLGHASPTSTYWYLEAVPELMAVVARRVAAVWEGRS